MSGEKRILLIDNEEGLCRLMEQILLDNGYIARAYTSPQKALYDFSPDAWDAVITDIKMPEMSGLELLKKVRGISRDIPVIMITAYATVEMSIQALRMGAYDMLTKPFEPEELVYRVKNALNQSRLIEENRELRHELESKFRFENIIGASPGLEKVLEKVEKVAVRDTSVLVTGESGTGKELVAQAIHYNSPRRGGKFVAINCGALTETLLESELFGHRKGAFTGAAANRLGLLEAADGGTLFLDEVGNLPMSVQKTLLRFIQEKEFIRVGETAPTRVDVRIISATNADLKERVRQGTFRDDLYYRLDVVNIHLLPLRERRSDIPQLTAHFINQQNKRFGTRIRGFSKDAIPLLNNFGWPGNVRQLKNVIEACMTMESEEYISTGTLRQFIEPEGLTVQEKSTGKAVSDNFSFDLELEIFERGLLKKVLKKNYGNIDAAAKEAEMNIATMYRKIKKYGLLKNEYR